MMEQIMDKLRQRGSPGAHLGLSMVNTPAFGFYQRLGFHEAGFRLGQFATGGNQVPLIGQLDFDEDFTHMQTVLDPGPCRKE